MRDRDNPQNRVHDAEIVPMAPGAGGAIELRRAQAELVHWKQRALNAEAELAELQRMESLGNVEVLHREKQIREYLAKIEELNLNTPGGLRSQPLAESGEDQALVNEAYLIFCERRRGGSSRF